MPRREDSHVNVRLDRYEEDELLTLQYEPSLELPLLGYIDEDDDVTSPIVR